MEQALPPAPPNAWCQKIPDFMVLAALFLLLAAKLTTLAAYERINKANHSRRG
jgi:hypothetical protein